MIQLIIINSLPERGDSLIAFKPHYMRELNKNLIILNNYKKTSDSIILDQERVIAKLNDNIRDKDKQLENKNKQIGNLQQIEKNVKKGYRRKIIGISVGSISVGITVGLVLPYILR